MFIYLHIPKCLNPVVTLEFTNITFIAFLYFTAIVDFSITSIIPLYNNIYSTYIEIWLVETIPRDIYQSIVFPSQQHRISLSTISYFPSYFPRATPEAIMTISRDTKSSYLLYARELNVYSQKATNATSKCWVFLVC
jgi:hypothetical protein